MPYNSLMNRDMTAKLRELMERHHLSANALADASGVPQPTISRFLSGKHQGANITTLKQIADYFRITVSELIGEKELVHSDYDLSIIDVILDNIQTYEQSAGTVLDNKQKKNVILDVYDILDSLDAIEIDEKAIKMAVSLSTRTRSKKL